MLTFNIFDATNNVAYTIQGGDIAIGLLAGLFVALIFWVVFKGA